MVSTHGTGLGAFSTGDAFLGIVFTDEAAVQEYLRCVEFVQARKGNATASAAVA